MERTLRGRKRMERTDTGIGEEGHWTLKRKETGLGTGQNNGSEKDGNGTLRSGKKWDRESCDSKAVFW